MKKGNWLFVFTLVIIAGLSRLLPHPPNFTAIGAMALFGGAALSNKMLRVILPLGALFISDVIINNTIYASSLEGFTLFYEGAIWTYVGIAAIALIAPFVIQKLSIKNIVVGSIAASGLFFLVSNFGVWASGMMYPLTFEGLGLAYLAGIPFFGNTLIGDLFFSSVLFGGFYLAEVKFPKLALNTK